MRETGEGHGRATSAAVVPTPTHYNSTGIYAPSLKIMNINKNQISIYYMANQFYRFISR